MKRTVLFVLCLLWSGVLVYPQAVHADAKEVVITVNTGGFEPPLITLKVGEPVKLVFIRKTDQTCATKVKIPEMDIDAELPLNKPVSFDLKPERTGEIGFTCPMDMLKGKIKVGK